MKKANSEFEEWLSTKSEATQKLGKKYPFGHYRIKKDAPYGIACEGTKVTLYGYGLKGHVSVVVLADDKLPKAIEHEKWLGETHGHSPESIEALHKKDIGVLIESKWLEPWE